MYSRGLIIFTKLIAASTICFLGCAAASLSLYRSLLSFFFHGVSVGGEMRNAKEENES
jgi:hypothetical protein